MMRTEGLFKAVRPDGTTRNGLDWNVPIGTVVRADHNVAEVDHGSVCSRREGDGISVAKTWKGAAQAGFPTGRCCTVEIDPADVLAEDDDMVRVRAVTVGEWFDAPGLLRRGCGRGADLRNADLYGADLRGADLSEADLYRAHLTGAHLAGAHLAGAHLAGAHLYNVDLYNVDLYNVDLRNADLYGAHLTGAHLTGADLAGVDLTCADLTYADLTYADLTCADLTEAHLTYANLGDWERGPDGYARRKVTP